jgi:hypothetical protein
LSKIPNFYKSSPQKGLKVILKGEKFLDKELYLGLFTFPLRREELET